MENLECEKCGWKFGKLFPLECRSDEVDDFEKVMVCEECFNSSEHRVSWEHVCHDCLTIIGMGEATNEVELEPLGMVFLCGNCAQWSDDQKLLRVKTGEEVE